MSDVTVSPLVMELGDKFANLTIVQAVELKEYLKSKYGLEPAAGGVVAMAPAAAAAGAAPAAPAAEPTEFNVILEAGFDATKKIAILKVVRESMGLGLTEAKAFVEGAPKTVKENVDKKTAEEIKKKLEEAGAKITIKPAG